MVAVFKQEAHELIDNLPAGAGWKELEEQARFRRKVQEGIDAADRGEFASEEEVRAVFARYGVNYEA